MNTNARSLVKHVGDYKVLLELIREETNFSFDIISFCETWLNDSLEDIASIENYASVFRHKSPNKEGGGLGFFVRSDLLFTVRKDLCIPEEYISMFECLFIEIQTCSSSKNLVVGNLYRSPSYPSEQAFTEVLDTLLAKVNGENKQVVIVGDVNIDLLKINSHRQSNAYLDSMISNGLIPTITLPTRVTDASSTLIDHIFVNISSSQHMSGTITSDITDHFINFLLTPTTASKVKSPKYVTFRRFTTENIASLQESLATTDWSSVMSCQNVDMGYEKFSVIYKEKLDIHIPIKTMCFNKFKHKKEPWISNGIINSIKRKDKLYKMYRNLTAQDAKKAAHDKYKI
jgi:exonuclease III